MTTNEDFEHFNIYDEEVAQRLGQFYETARHQCPIISTDSDGGYSILTRYDDVKTALGDPETFSSSWGVPNGKMEPPIIVDPPTHRDYRLLLNRFFSYRSLEAHQARIREIANRQIDKWIDKGEVEFVHEFADPYTATVLAEIIFNDTDSSWTQEIQTALEENATKGDHATTFGLARVVAKEKMAARLASGERKDDVLDALLYGTIEDRPLTQEEREGTLITLFGGGLDTTKASLTGITLHTARAPELEDRIRDINWEDPTLDEFIRELSPVSNFGRIATTDTKLGGYDIAAGTKFMVSFFSANHDETKFPNPNELDFSRDSKQHVGFGYGIHRCIGSQLAKLQIGIGLQELFKRITNVRLADDEIVYCAGLPRFVKNLRITFDRVPD
jgi:cytochrome P450